MTRITLRLLAVGIMAYPMTASAGQTATGPQTPVADHRQHLMSPALAAAWKLPAAVTADDVIAQLDSAGIRRAAVLSIAYAWGSDSLQGGGAEEYARVRTENDWTAAQAARYPDRLLAVCSVNPLKEYAIAEIDRCAATPALRAGLKLHFANSGVDLRDSRHVQQLRRVFRAANAHRMAIVVHVWTGDDAAFMAARIRQIGLQRILYGSDMAVQGNPAARESWTMFRMKTPLTAQEFETIAANVAPYLQDVVP